MANVISRPLTYRAFLLMLLSVFIVQNCIAQTDSPVYHNHKIKVGAERLRSYVKHLKNKNVGLVVNQTSIVGNNKTHLVDTLLSQGITIKAIFAPEHGFRGEADAGEKVNNSVDTKTGITIISIYGSNRKPSPSDLKGIDVLVFDIQDVGVRFYTYISTLQYIMEAAAENNIPLIVLDRPNPNGHYVDGPVLDKTKDLTSFVGMQPVPVVYGMTVGEYAQMLNGEGWLAKGVKANMRIVKNKGYSHKTHYNLPVKPSPNLPNNRAIYLYPSICYFEGTDVSVGRGTPKQFQVIGSPYIPSDSAYTFTPQPFEGAKTPVLEGQKCYGIDLTTIPLGALQREGKINLTYLLTFYNQFTDKSKFFLKGNFFDKLAGTYQLREQLIAGKSENEIRQSWQVGLNQFKNIRKKYLLYRDF